MSVKCPSCETENTSDSQFCKKCATPLPFARDISVTKTLETPAKGLAIGSTFAGRYQIVQELGKGGMGAVYKALDTHINEEVAIKLIRPEIAADEKVLERFSNELKLARKIAHKNVCRMFHLDKEGETPYISMEYLEGEDLKSLIREKEKLPAEEAVSIAMQVCEGLVEAHRLGVVHRDLKPQNIMIAKDGQAKIMDFGIARSLEAPGVTQTGVIIGTPDYISPEQAEGQEADHRSDIYSLGVILYEMVTGSVPFKGDTALSVALKHKAQLPLDPRKRNPEIPDDLSRLILICMEKDRNRRYQTAKDLLDDLRNIEHGLPLGTKIRPHRQAAISNLLRRKWFIPAAVILAAAIIGIVLWRVLPSRSPVVDLSGKPSIAVLDFQNRTGDASMDIHAENLSIMLNFDLVQSKHLSIIPDDTIYEILSELNLVQAERFTTKNLRDIARNARTSYILRGYLIRSGNSFLIDASLRETRKMETVGSYQVQGPGEESFSAMVDELTRLIKSNFLSETEISHDYDEDVGIILSKSPEALRLYREGIRYTLSDPQKCVELLEKAVEIDPEFAMAYRILWSTYLNRLGDQGKAGEHRKKALEMIDKFSQRDRLHILYISTSDPKEREKIAKQLLNDYPDDWLMKGNLGSQYIGHERFEEAAQLCESVVATRIKEEFPYVQLAWTYLAMGKYDEVENVAEIFKKEIVREDVFFLPLAYAYAAQGKKDLALSELEKMAELPKDINNPRFIGDLYVGLGHELEGEKLYRHMLDIRPQSRRIYQNLMADLSCLQGKFRKAEEHLKEALRLAEESGWKIAINWQHEGFSLFYCRQGNIEKALEEIENSGSGVGDAKIEIYAAAKRMDKARELTDIIKKYKESQKVNNIKGVTRKYLKAEGLISLEKGDYAEAIKYFKEAQSFLAFPFPDNMWEYAWYFEPLALAYYRSGDLEKAQEEFEKISKMTLGRVKSWDIYAKSFYMLGKISEERGWPGKAIEHYEKFLEVWKDADPDIPEIGDARQRLSDLQSQ